MDVKKPEDALFEGLKEVRQAADHLEAATRNFDSIKIEDVEPKMEFERLAIKTAHEALMSLKKLVDEMQNDWNCWSEDRYKDVSMQCFEEMSKLKGPEAALSYQCKTVEGAGR